MVDLRNHSDAMRAGALCEDTLCAGEPWTQDEQACRGFARGMSALSGSVLGAGAGAL